MAGLTPDQARHVIEEAVARVAPDADLASLAPDADLRDGLELDSLDFLRVVENLPRLAGARALRDVGAMADRLRRMSGWVEVPG